MTDKVITFFDLFAGIGGFHLALKRLGWKCVGFCEIDRHCRKTYFVSSSPGLMIHITIAVGVKSSDE